MDTETRQIYERVKSRLKRRVVDLLDGKSETYISDRKRRALERSLWSVLRALPEEEDVVRLSDGERERLVQNAIDEIVGLGPLDRLLIDPTISEIMVNGPFEIFIERDGQLQRLKETFRDEQELSVVIERMLGSAGVTVNESHPVCDATLLDGSRINVIISPLVLQGPVITIRRKLRDWTMEDYLSLGSLNQQQAEFLEACVKAKVNIVISGGTSTGKTSLVAILSAYIPHDHRVITIENVPELELHNRDHWIRLVCRPPNLEGQGEIPLRVLVKNALRMRPDRIILGEARGGEALDVVQAMHTGHDGFITVLHANTPRAALERLQTLMLMSGLDLPPAACRTQIASAVDIVIHITRFADGSRRVETITQVLGTTEEGFELEDLFTLEAEGFSSDGKLRGTVRYSGARPNFLSKFGLNNVAVPAWMTR